MRTVISFSLNEPVPASQYLRQTAPLQALAQAGRIRLIDGRRIQSGDFAALPSDSILFLQRDFTPYRALLNRPFPVIYDLDDNLFDLPPDHPDAAHYGPVSTALRECINRFSAVTVSTENLRQQLAPHHPNVVVVPNRLPFYPDVAPKSLRILISGTPSHLSDIDFLVPVLERVARAIPVQILFWGYYPEKLPHLTNIGVIEQFSAHYPDYLKTLGGLGAAVGLIPLADRTFNQAKSDLKFREYTAAKMAILASDVGPYRTIRHGIDGYVLPNDPFAWESALAEVLRNPSGQLVMANNAFRRVTEDEPFDPEILGKVIDSIGESQPVVITPPQIKASIVIPVFNHVELTRACIGAVSAYSSDYELIVVDNASTDGTAEYLCKMGSRVRVITNRENLGFARACNQGAAVALGKYIVFLNNDTRVHADWLDVLVQHMETHPETGIAGCKLLYEDGTIQHAGAAMRYDKAFFRHPYKFMPGDHPLVNRERETDAVTAACFITPKTLFDKIGRFDEAYLNGCEDMDYCTAVREAGFTILYLPSSVVTHLESKTPRPKPSDTENFTRYIHKWGADRMMNEIEFYAQDGFWKHDGGEWKPMANPYVKEFKNRLDNAAALGNATETHRWTEILSRIYPTEVWHKTPAVRNSTGLKILFVCHDFPPYRFAGAQLYARYLARELIKRGHDVRIFHPVGISDRKPGESSRLFDIVESRYEDLRVYQINVNDREPDSSRHPQHCFEHPEVENAFTAFLTREHFDIVHYHLLYRLSGGLPAITKRMGIPTTATLHDYWGICATGHLIDTNGRDCSGPESYRKCADCATGFTGNPGPWIVDFFSHRQPALQKAYRNIDRVFSPSAYLADFYAKFGFQRPEVMPLGWLPVAPVTRRQPDGTVVFGFAGQAILRKGLDLLVDALYDIPETNWKLLIWGKSNRHPFFQDILPRIEAHPRITYMGGFEPEDLPSIYSQIDVSVIPSRRENYPLTLLETMSAGVPPVVANVGGVPEMIRDREEGFIFPNGNVEILRGILRAIIQRPELIDAFRRNLKPGKDIADDARDYEEIYLGLRETH
jgi:GT2 family glycosyltransferase/glycosyltransferase involved in cell wall biosynthesis